MEKLKVYKRKEENFKYTVKVRVKQRKDKKIYLE